MRSPPRSARRFIVIRRRRSTRHYQVFAGAFADVDALVCYAMKANSNQAVVRDACKARRRRRRGVGRRTQARAGAPAFPPTRSCSPESARRRPNLRSRSTKAFFASTSNPSPNSNCCRRLRQRKGRTAHVSVRVNPDIDAKTHHKIATGKAENKFGIPISRAREIYAHAGKLKGLKVAGVDMHIGSQITELDPFGNAFALLADFVRTLRADGHTISHVDLGGGLGIPYRDDNEPPPHPEAYAKVVKQATRDLDCRLIFEPGRLLVGNAGILVTRVLFVKHGEAKNFVVVDAAMNDLIRPTLYDAHHEIWPVAQQSSSARRIRADVVGPVCESGDFLAVNRDMAEPAAGDVACRNVGRRLWRGPGRHLQHAGFGAGSAGQWRANGRWCARALKLTN